ncbi:hypothetical protein [Conexibacter woesei]|uniref:hypothetical protein n=1 Tax=Conexibacter woesei TaxID=191495 RepID=UPI0012DBD8C5|nr:hypothetical protein [Conexibacter woesei]
MARALVAALVLLVSGLTAGTAVARDGGPPAWWHWHHGHGAPPTTTSTTATRGSDDGDDDDQGRGTTTTGATTTTATGTTTTTTTATPTAPSDPVPATTTAPAHAPAPPAAAAAPVLDRTVAVAATAGSVNVRRPGADAQPLTTAPLALPTGTRVDTRHGEVALTSAVDARGTTQTGRFSGGVFEVQAAAHGYTRLVLVGGHWASCKITNKSAHAAYVGSRAHAAKKKKARPKPIRSLWGQDDHGRFQTRGSGSVATVRGTRWLTTDTCAGTTTTVTKGAVDVRSRRTGHTTRVTAGHSLFVAR